ncbi:MAG: TRAP transporter small permease [bacterium]|nr:TRAP transporter small permease [bacterium]
MKILRLFEKIDKLFEYVIALLLAVLVTVNVASVFFRFVIQSSLVWADEFMRYTFIWMVFFSLALLIIQKEHIAVDLTSLIFPKKYQQHCYFIGEIIALAAVTILFLLSLQIVRRTMGVTSISLQIPMGYVYMCIPIGFFFTMINYSRLIVIEWKARHEEPEKEERT